MEHPFYDFQCFIQVMNMFQHMPHRNAAISRIGDPSLTQLIKYRNAIYLPGIFTGLVIGFHSGHFQSPELAVVEKFAGTASDIQNFSCMRMAGNNAVFAFDCMDPCKFVYSAE